MYVCVYVYMYMYVCIYIYIYTPSGGDGEAAHLPRAHRAPDDAREVPEGLQVSPRADPGPAYIYIYIYICIHTHMYVCMYIYIYVYTCIYIDTYICIVQFNHGLICLMSFLNSVCLQTFLVCHRAPILDPAEREHPLRTTYSIYDTCSGV